ncbi:hypothetical protein LPJ56_006917, partial [Coemansia sp. RSA 2599]
MRGSKHTTALLTRLSRASASNTILKSPGASTKSAQVIAELRPRSMHTATPVFSDCPPARDGDELFQPLEPADLRAFWDKAVREARSPQGLGDGSEEIASLSDLVSTIVDKRSHKGAMALGQVAQKFCDLYETLDSDARTKFL